MGAKSLQKINTEKSIQAWCRDDIYKAYTKPVCQNLQNGNEETKTPLNKWGEGPYPLSACCSESIIQGINRFNTIPVRHNRILFYTLTSQLQQNVWEDKGIQIVTILLGQRKLKTHSKWCKDCLESHSNEDSVEITQIWPLRAVQHNPRSRSFSKQFNSKILIIFI